MIERAECFEMRPKDRDYNKRGKKREAQMEVLGGGLMLLAEDAIRVRLAHMGER